MIVPASGCRVRTRRSPNGVGVVQGATDAGQELRVRVAWHGGHVTEEPLPNLEPALVPGWEVVHAPVTVGAETFGHGTVEQLRVVAGRHQALVDFWSRDARVWLPWQHLVPVMPLQHRFLRAVHPKEGDAEAFRLRNLAYALDQWHSNTGALTRLEIDPLPHQIQLVHKILASGDLNWMIADDVGLGKTIEVGLLLSALRVKRRERFLLVVPAGLTRQWKEEMRDKFGLDDFFVYGDDVVIDEPSKWRLFDRVIISVDRLKRENHLSNVLDAEPWDVVVFDEAHRLTREEYGLKRTATDRFKSAAALRSRANAMLLLTGTPHQGRDDRFQALLELLRPGKAWKERFRRLRQNPEVLREVVIRNRKADVTDAEGSFIFMGKDVRTVSVPTSPLAQDFDAALRKYVRRGYAASSGVGPTSKPIGFVMTVYRKLAASSHAAIAKALSRRMGRLRAGSESPDESVSHVDDERFVEAEEERAHEDAPASEFFAGERGTLKPLVEQAQALAEDDRKLAWFLDEIVVGLKEDDPDAKLLVFTEYRTTQQQIATALRARYGDASVALIHGGQPFEQRRQQIDTFETQASFLVSTEAGGEGLNLHRACHMMVNYDLPWNPMRLVQRVGRLYRYGQTHRVQVINLHAPDSLDEKVLNKMYERLDAVAADMAGVGGDFAEGRAGLQEDILGELVSKLDVEALLEATELDEDRSEERLQEALQRAQDATKNQDEILRYASGYDPGELARDLRLGREHLIAFAEGSCTKFGVEIAARRYGGTVYDLKLPEGLRERLGSRQNVRIAFERSRAARADGAEMFGPDHPLYRVFSKAARAYDAGGHAASLEDLNGRAAMSAMLRWIDDHGRPLFHEYVSAILRNDGAMDVNHTDWADFLLHKASDGAPPAPPFEGAWDAMVAELERELARRAGTNVHPDSPYRLGVAWLSARSSRP